MDDSIFVETEAGTIEVVVPIAEFVNDDETPGDVNLVSAVVMFC